MASNGRQWPARHLRPRKDSDSSSNALRILEVIRLHGLPSCCAAAVVHELQKFKNILDILLPKCIPPTPTLLATAPFSAPPRWDGRKPSNVEDSSKGEVQSFAKHGTEQRHVTLTSLDLRRNLPFPSKHIKGPPIRQSLLQGSRRIEIQGV